MTLSGWRECRLRAAILIVMLGLIVGISSAALGRPQNKRRGRAAKVQTTSPGRPTLKYEQFRRTIEFQVAEKREEQIAGLKQLLTLGADDGEMPDLKFRLGELYYEKSRFYFFRAQEAEEAIEAAGDPAAKATKAAERQEFVKNTQLWLERALDVYREIRDRYPKYKRGPDVLFALGQSYWSLQRFDEAIAAYADLIKNFRDSPLVAESWLAFGEYYFNQGSVYKALKSYEKAAEDKRSRVYGFALYKQAWCYYNLAEWRRALRLFRGTVLYSQLSDQLSGENKIALGREAQKDWVRTYAHIGDAKGAKHQIADLLGVDDCSGARCQKLVEQLAALWFDDGYFAESAYLYKTLIQMSPRVLRNAYYQSRVVDLVSRSGNKARVIRETKSLVSIYEATRQQLKDTPDDDGASNFDEAELSAETTMRRLAQLWNREAKKTRNDKTYAYAETMYTEYLQLFGATKYAYEMRFQLGDLLYRLEKFDRAAAAYEATVLADPKGKYVAEAANDNILAVEEHIKDLGLRRPKLTGAEPVPLHPQKKRLVDACDRYLKYVAPDEEGRFVAIKFKAGKVLYDHNQHAEALRRLDDVVTAHASSSQAEFAANLVIDVHNLREDWQGLYDSASKYAKLAALIDGRPKLAQELAQFGEYAKFKLVQQVEARMQKEDGDLRKVAEAYQEFTAEFPASKNADKALFNASVAWDRSGEPERADVLRRRLLKQYPDSPLVAEVALYVAEQAAARADYTVAAQAYLKFVRKFPQDERARDAMYNAAVFYAGLGKLKTATRLRTQYLKDYGKVRGGQREAAEIFWAMAQDLDRAGRRNAAAQRYREYSKTFPTTDRFWEALWREAEIRETDLGQKKAAGKIRRRIMGIYLNLKQRKRPITAPARRYASQVALRKADLRFEAYRRLRLKTPSLRNPKPFRRSLAQKVQMRSAVIREYTRVVSEFQAAESSIASLFRVARSWDLFVEAIEGLPCPRGLDEATCDALKIRLDEDATPAREAAIQAYQACVDKSNQLNVFTSFSTRCVRALETRAPDRYPQIIEKRLGYDPPVNVKPLDRRPLMLDPASGATEMEALR